jgi:thioredoxin 1
VTFVKVDVDELDGVAANCGVRCMPTFLVYNDGKATDGKLEGASQDALEALVKRFA